MRAGKDEAVLLPAALFVNGETLPSRKGNRHAAIRNVGVADELGQQIAGWSAHGEHRRNGSAENRRDPGHIDATAACIVSGMLRGAAIFRVHNIEMAWHVIGSIHQLETP